MSMLTDVLKSGASSVAGAVSETLGIDPATAQGLVDQAETASDNRQSTDDNPAGSTETAPVAEEGVIGKVTSMLGGAQEITDRAKALLDQDGDGNPLNDVTSMVGKFFGKSS